MRPFLQRAVAGVAAMVVLAFAAPAYADNNQTFMDATGDNQGAGTANFALDIISTNVDSKDNGLVTFTVTVQSPVANQGQLMFNGDEVDVLIDADQNPSTGDPNGFEAGFKAFGNDGQPPTAQFCNLSATNQLTCEPILAQNFASSVMGQQETLTFKLVQSDLTTIGFTVVTSYPNGAGGFNHDLLPDTGLDSFDLRADPDGDGYTGDGDACPNTPAGQFDTNHDGCPGPYLKLPLISIRYGGFTTTSSTVRYSSFSVVEIPAKATVKVQTGKSTFSRKGPGAIAGLANRTLASGTKITITVSQPGHCNSQRVIRISPRAGPGFVTLSNRTGIKPGGSIGCA